MPPRRPDPHTRDLFALPEPTGIGYGEVIYGKGSLASKIARVVSRAMQDARDETGLGRAALAAAMTEKLGRSISETTLDKWASEAAEENRIPLDAFVTLIGETRAFEALGFVPGLFGYVVVEHHYLELIELQQIDEMEALLLARRETIRTKRRARS